MWFDPTAAAVQNAAQAMYGSGGKGYGKMGGGGGGWSPQPRSRGVCFVFRDSGYCKEGDNCRFEHIRGNGDTVGGGRRKLTGSGQNTDTNNGHNETVDYTECEHKGGCRLTVWEPPPITKALTLTEKTEDNGVQLLWRTNVSDGCNHDVIVKIVERLHRKSKDKLNGLMIGPKRARELALKTLADLEKVTDPFPIPIGSDEAGKTEIGELRGMVSTLTSGFQAQQESLAAQTQSLTTLATSVQQSIQAPRMYGQPVGPPGAGVRRAAVLPRGGLPRKNMRMVGGVPLGGDMFGEDEEMPGESEDEEEMELLDRGSDPLGQGDAGGGGGMGGQAGRLTPEQSAAAWDKLKELSMTTTELLKNVKRVSPSQLLVFNEAEPLPACCAWMLPFEPVNPAVGPMRVFTTQNMDLLASIFELCDFELAKQSIISRVLETANPLQKPCQRLGILAQRYGVDLQGKLQFVRVVVTVSLCIARNSRESAARQPIT